MEEWEKEIVEVDIDPREDHEKWVKWGTLEELERVVGRYIVAYSIWNPNLRMLILRILQETDKRIQGWRINLLEFKKHKVEQTKKKPTK